MIIESFIGKQIFSDYVLRAFGDRKKQSLFQLHT